MTYEQLKAWWYQACPPSADQCDVTAKEKRAGFFSDGKPTSEYGLIVAWDGYRVSVDGKSPDEVYAKALKLIGDKPEFKATSVMIEPKPEPEPAFNGTPRKPWFT